jgi:hypothetical protein
MNNGAFFQRLLVRHGIFPMRRTKRLGRRRAIQPRPPRAMKMCRMRTPPSLKPANAAAAAASAASAARRLRGLRSPSPLRPPPPTAAAPAQSPLNRFD